MRPPCSAILLQNDAVVQQLAAIFSHCFGPAPLPAIPEIKAALSAQLGKEIDSDACVNSCRVARSLPDNKIIIWIIWDRWRDIFKKGCQIQLKIVLECVKLLILVRRWRADSNYREMFCKENSTSYSFFETWNMRVNLCVTETWATCMWLSRTPTSHLLHSGPICSLSLDWSCEWSFKLCVCFNRPSFPE